MISTVLRCVSQSGREPAAGSRFVCAGRHSCTNFSYMCGSYLNQVLSSSSLFLSAVVCLLLRGWLVVGDSCGLLLDSLQPLGTDVMSSLPPI